MASVEELKEDIEELQKLHEQATRPKVKDLLFIDIRKLQSEVTRLNEARAAEGKAADGEQVQPIKVVRPEHEASKPQRYTETHQTYAWDQSDKFMKIYATLPGVHKIDGKNIACEYTNSSFRLFVQDLDNKNHVWHVVDLWEDIVPDKCYHKVKTDMVLLMLKKEEEKKTWAYVTKKDDAKKKKKKPDQNKDPEAGLMDLLKDMYEDGDDDMKRTIAQAWTRSQDKKSGNPDVPDL